MPKLPKIEIPEHFRHSLRSNTTALLQWTFLSLLVGIVVGLVGTLFHVVLEYAAELRIEYPWLLYCLPIAGVLIVLLYRVMGMENDKGTETVIASVRSNALVRLRVAPVIFISTTLTHLTGGSAGREGAALQLGGSIASSIGRALKLDERDQRVISMCGMSTGFSALFGTPLSAAVFSMEMESVGVMYYAALVPCLLGALTAQQVAAWWGIQPTAFHMTGAPAEPTMRATLALILLGVLCGVIANLFCRLLQFAGSAYKTYFPNKMKRILVGSVLVIVLTLLSGTRDYNGAGMDVIVRAVAGEAVPWAFILKMVFTAVTLNAGFKGGEIVPSFFAGATFGCVFAPLVGLDPSFGACVGMVCVFCGVTNSPMTSILLAYELFGGEMLVMMTIAIAVSYMTSGYHSLYHEQKIVYSKIKAKYINASAGQDVDE